eukprot:10541140-Prorocentrum_lima.AAC.1
MHRPRGDERPYCEDHPLECHRLPREPGRGVSVRPGGAAGRKRALDPTSAGGARGENRDVPGGGGGDKLHLLRARAGSERGQEAQPARSRAGDHGRL